MVADVVQPDAKNPLVIDSLIDSSVLLRRSRDNAPLSIRELDSAEQGLDFVQLRPTEVPRKPFVVDQPRYSRGHEKAHDSDISILLLIELK